MLIAPFTAHGTVSAPPSKSAALRLLLGAALTEGTSEIRGVGHADDILAAIDCIRALGTTVSQSGDALVVTGIDPRRRTAHVVLPCRESASLLRFLIPVCLLSDAPATLTGAARLFARPHDLYRPFCTVWDRTDTSLTVAGRLRSGTYTLRGDVSSQFISGMLFALPFVGGTLRLLPSTGSRPYLDLTLAVLRRFGADAAWNGDTIRMPQSAFSPIRATVEGDWSGAANLLAFRSFGGDVTVTGLNPDSVQGDRVFPALQKRLEADCAEIDLADCPDLGPILFALAAALNGAVFSHAERLRLKESDRIAAMQAELEKCGVSVTERGGTVTVGTGLRSPTGPLFCHNDHRIAMALVPILSVTGGQLEGMEAVSKSYPDYRAVIRALGGKI